MKNFNKIYFLTGLLFLAACKPEVNVPAPKKGSADFTRFIAVGNSLTAGYADGGLYLEGQENSYPSIIAKQMKAVGAGTFNQPLFNSNQADGSGYLHLKGFNALGSPILDTIATHNAIRGTATFNGFTAILYTKYSGDIDNYGVPGIKLQHITLPYYGNLNGFFERFLPVSAPNAVTTSYLDFVTSKPFTFFSDWLGNNDALLYATSGGAGDVLTDPAVFASLYTASITALTKNNAKGVVATIPDVTSIPYFSTVTVAAVLAGVQKVAPTVKDIYINALVPGTTSSYQPRAATPADLLVLSTPTAKVGVPNASGFPYGLDPRNPIDNKYVLDGEEVKLAENAVQQYNTTIKSVAASKGLAVFDAYAFLNDFKKNGLLINGVNLNASYVTGGVFSLDGVHLTPRGYAIVANEFIKAINKTYGSSIPLADVSSFRGVKFPDK